jgi:hypothetical protein
MEQIDFIKQFEDVNTPYFGGSLAYAQISLNLSMLCKLIDFKSKKAENKSTYLKIKSIAKSLIETSNIMIDKDGQIFDQIRKCKNNTLQVDKILEVEYPKSIAFLENLNTIEVFINALILETNSSIKYDFIMIKESLISCYNNLVHILEYEVKRTTSDKLQEERYLQIDNLRKEHI